MAKSAFDDNIPRVRPRLRLGKALADIDSATEPPPPRTQQAFPVEPAAAPEPPSEEPPLAVVEPPDLLQFRAEEPTSIREPAPASMAPVDVPSEPDLRAFSEHVPHVAVAVPAVGQPESLPAEPETAFSSTLAEPIPPAPELPSALPESRPPAAPPPQPLVEDNARRSSLKRRAVGLSALVQEPPSATPTALLEELDALESTAALASELQRALDAAADANEHLRSDLSAALDDLARSTAESKRLQDRADKLEAEARDRGKVVQDLIREMEMLEAERDSALGQSSDAQLEFEAQTEKMLVLERRTHELERALSDAQARTKRFEEAAQAHATQRAALRAELEAVRHERDELLARNAELEREREDLNRSRKALDEVHRALSEARSRAQRIRPR